MPDNSVLPYRSSESCRDTTPATIAGYAVAGAVNGTAILLAVLLASLVRDRYEPTGVVLVGIFVGIPAAFVQFLFGGMLTLLCASRHGHHWIGVPAWERGLVVLGGIATLALPAAMLLAVVIPQTRY